MQEQIWRILEEVKDPEIPALSVVDMGIVTAVQAENKTTAHITITPTFVGCPALDVIKKSIQEELLKNGFEQVTVSVDLETAWNSNRLSAAAKEKLEKFGLAPPPVLEGELTLEQLNRVRCPHCHSSDTTLRSAFGSTLCRAIRFCFSCKQGFEQFKPIS